MEIVNAKLPKEKQIYLSFSNGWLEKFKSRWRLRSWKSYGESGSADNEAIALEFPVLQAYLRNFSLRDIFNAYEFRAVLAALSRPYNCQAAARREKSTVIGSPSSHV